MAIPRYVGWRHDFGTSMIRRTVGCVRVPMKPERGQGVGRWERRTWVVWVSQWWIPLGYWRSPWIFLDGGGVVVDLVLKDGWWFRSSRRAHSSRCMLLKAGVQRLSASILIRGMVSLILSNFLERKGRASEWTS